jgi:general secretion pathway protein G
MWLRAPVWAYSGETASLFVPVHVTALRHAREWTLQQNLYALRGIINQYTLDKQRRPQSLNDLVGAGYLRQKPYAQGLIWLRPKQTSN